MWSAGWTSGMYSKDMFILTCLPTWGLNFCIKPGIPADEMDKAANTWDICRLQFLTRMVEHGMECIRNQK